MRSLYFVGLAVLLLAALGAILLRYYLRARRSDESTWEDILKRLTWVDRDNISMVALDVIEESGEPRPQEESFALDPSRIWTLLGGLEGLEVI